jgi:hypothetical protein
MRHELQLSPHRLDVAPQRRKEQVAPSFDARNRVLTQTEAFRKLDLGMREPFAKVLERGRKLACAPLDLRAALGGQSREHLV